MNKQEELFDLIHNNKFSKNINIIKAETTFNNIVNTSYRVKKQSDVFIIDRRYNLLTNLKTYYYNITLVSVNSRNIKVETAFDLVKNETLNNWRKSRIKEIYE